MPNSILPKIRKEEKSSHLLSALSGNYDSINIPLMKLPQKSVIDESGADSQASSSSSHDGTPSIESLKLLLSHINSLLEEDVLGEVHETLHFISNK